MTVVTFARTTVAPMVFADRHGLRLAEDYCSAEYRRAEKSSSTLLMRYTLLVALLLSLSVAGFSQSPTTTSIPSITQIIGWVGLSPSDFDSKVRDFGFTAEGNYVKDYGKDYVYVRKSVEGEIVLTERIILHIFSSNGGQQIQFVTAGPDLIKLYKPQLVQKGFKPTTCLLGDAENEMNFCYVSSSYRAILTDTRTQLSLGEGNTYSLVLKQLK